MVAGSLREAPVSELDLTKRASFTYFYQEKLRFSDTDMIGHVNNVAFAALFESGRVNFTRNGPIQTLPPDTLMVMRRIEIDYRGELHWPAEVDIGSRLLRIGTTSATIGNGLFHGEFCAATSITILVLIDRVTRKATAIPGDVRASMEKYLSPG